MPSYIPSLLQQKTMRHAAGNLPRAEKNQHKGLQTYTSKRQQPLMFSCGWRLLGPSVFLFRQKQQEIWKKSGCYTNIQ